MVQGVSYSYWLLVSNGKDLASIKECVEDGRLKPVVGTRVHFKDMDAVKSACDLVYSGKGGIRKAVISFE